MFFLINLYLHNTPGHTVLGGCLICKTLQPHHNLLPFPPEPCHPRLLWSTLALLLPLPNRRNRKTKGNSMRQAYFCSYQAVGLLRSRLRRHNSIKMAVEVQGSRILFHCSSTLSLSLSLYLCPGTPVNVPNYSRTLLRRTRRGGGFHLEARRQVFKVLKVKQL